MTNDKLASITKAIRSGADFHEKLYTETYNTVGSPVSVVLRDVSNKIEALEEFYPAEYPSTVDDLANVAPYTPVMVVAENGKHIVCMKHSDSLWYADGSLVPMSSKVLIEIIEKIKTSYLLVLPVPTKVL